MPLEGTFTALITPFESSGAIDWKAFERIVKSQVESGIDGLVPCGTTGESPTLTHEEHNQVIAKTVEWSKELNPNSKIIAGTGSNSTSEAVQLTQKAASEGADYALLVNPYYNKPTQEGLYIHFSRIADRSDIPIVLYNIPSRTAVQLELETIIRLSKHENIAAVKEATGNLNLMTQIILETDENFSLLSGDDNLLLPILSIGGRGVISVASNAMPAQVKSITSNYLAGNVSEAQRNFWKLFPFFQAIFLETNPIPIKFAMSEIGFCGNFLRPPLTPLSKIYSETVKERLSL